MDRADERQRAALRAFFERYARASEGEDPTVLAVMYAASFIVGGPQGSMAFANDGRFLDWLTQLFDFNRRHGMRGLHVVSLDAVPLSPLHALAVVRWGVRFEKTADRLVEFRISYLIESPNGGAKILAYVSQADQEAEMKRLGLLG
jgi:hypothetical protein